MIDRIRERAVFRTFGQDAARARSGPLTVVRAAAPARDRPAVAYAISRKVGGAVVRNRLRRQLRAAALELHAAGCFAPRAHLVVVRPEAVGSSLATLRRCLGDALDRLGPVEDDNARGSDRSERSG